MLPESFFRIAQAEVPIQPPGVPIEAIWVGGADGGVFLILTSVKNRQGRFLARIWNYPSGTLEFDGPLQLHPSDNAAVLIRTDDRSQFLGWDGSTLYLRNGTSLKAVK